MTKPATIAIDGPAAAGKDAVGSLLAKRLGYRFLDTGAMYRALTWQALRLNINLEDEPALTRLACETNIELLLPATIGERPKVLVDGNDVSLEIREQDIDRGVSLVARTVGVRQALVAKQRQMAQDGKLVMAGRDIGTVVLPNADLKIYLEASTEERARRRYLELQGYRRDVNYDDVLCDLRRRDRIDSERALSPLQPARDAKIINTDGLSVDQVLATIVDLTEEG